MHYTADTKNIREQKQAVDDAKLEIEIANKEKQIGLIEKEIDLLNEKKDALNEQISLLDEQIEKTNEFYDKEIEKTEKYYDDQIKAIDAQIESIDKQIEKLQKQREETEKYYETLIENLEKSKSKYQELTEIVEKAELSAALKKLGIDEEALLNGSEEEFEKVDEAASAIGSGVSEGEGKGSGSGNENNLIGSIVDLGKQTEETLGEPGGDGVIGRFEQFKEPIQQAEAHVKGIAEGLEEIDGKTVECTIKVKIETSGGGLPSVIGSGMNLGSATYEAKYLGNAHAEGTAMVSGNWAVQSNEDHALVGEVGRELIVRGGRFFTVGDNGAEMFNIKKGDIVFNHEQTEDLLKHGCISGRGKAYADGTVGGGKVLTKDGEILRPLQPGDRMYDLVQKFDAYFKSMDGNLEKLVPNSFYEHQKQMEDMAKQINYVSSVVNNNRNVQQPVVHQEFHITMPNVTDSTSASELMNDLQSISRKKFQMDW